MAKKSAKTVATKVVKAAPKRAASKVKKASAIPSIGKTAEDVLKKLKALDLEPSLQADLQWCIGSYRYDNNPSGLYTMIGKALPLLKVASSKDTKAVSAAFLKNVEKVMNSR